MSESTQPPEPGGVPAGPPPPRPELRRSRTDRILGGVATGLARYLNVDPALVRIGWVVVAVMTGGAAIVAYIVAWVLIPEEGTDAAAGAAISNEHGRFILGGILVVGGALWLVATIVPNVFRFSGFGALVLIAIGVVLVVQGARR